MISSQGRGGPEVRTLADDEAANLYADLSFPPGLARPHTVMNMVASLDGKIAIQGRSGRLGSALDHLVLRRLRAAVEGIIVGAGTLRAEEVEYRLPSTLLEKRLAAGLPPALTVVVISASGSIPPHRRLFSTPIPSIVPVVLTTNQGAAVAAGPLAGRARVVPLGDGEVDLPRAMAYLVNDLGLRRVVVEGGPTLGAHMLAGDLVDEVFLTLAPKVVGGSGPTMVGGTAPLPGSPRVVQLVSALAYSDELFLRYCLPCQ